MAMINDGQPCGQRLAHPEQACLATTKHTFLCSTWAATAVQNILIAETALGRKKRYKKTPPQHKKPEYIPLQSEPEHKKQAI